MPGQSDFLADIRAERKAISKILFRICQFRLNRGMKQCKISDDIPSLDERGVVILSSPQYSRYRAINKRIAGKETSWMHNSVVTALGGFTVPTRKTYVLFCRENFDYPELEEHPYLCNHLAPKLKGRPRKRKKVKRAGSPESESASSESSVSTSTSSNKVNLITLAMVLILD